MYVSSSREILLQCWNLHIRCRATVSSRVSRDCMLGYFGFFFCISSTLCCCCWSLLCWYGEECRVDQRKVNSLPCLFVRLNLCFSSLRWAPHTLSTQISSFTWYFFLFLFFFWICDQALQKQHNKTTIFHFIIQCAKLSLLSSDVRKKLSTLDTDLFFLMGF